MYCEALSVLPWNSGRAQDTSDYLMAESEHGLYLQRSGTVFYADRSDLTNWVALCTDPICSHDGFSMESDEYCTAYIGSTFHLRNGRIYYPAEISQHWQLLGAKPQDQGAVIASMTTYGTDHQVEYAFPREKNQPMCFVHGDCFLTFQQVMTQEGTYDQAIYGYENGNAFTLYEGSSTESDFYAGPATNLVYGAIHGDPVFFCSWLDPEIMDMYQVTDQNIVRRIDFDALDFESGYLSGNTLTYFRKSDGYYRLNTDTKEETKLADPQLPVSTAQVYYPNCILESTFIGANTVYFRETVQEHHLRFFDGQQWQEVTLPEEIRNLPEDEFLQHRGLTSDRFIFVHTQIKDGAETHTIYQILLGADNPTLERLGDIAIG